MSKSQTHQFPFHVHKVNRDIHIAEHKFLCEQVKEKVFSHFGSMDLENEVDSYVTKLFQKMHHVNIEDHMDYALQLSEEYGLLFYDMRENIYLASLAYIYFSWDKGLREFICDGAECSSEIKERIWGARNKEILKPLKKAGWSMKQKSDYDKLIIGRMVVNVFKHGDGSDLEKIKKSHQQYLCATSLGKLANYARYDELQINEAQFDEFASAILQFWEGFPTDETLQMEL